MGKIKHGLAYKHPLYTKWKAIRNRCNNHNCQDFQRYGGRGIKIDKDWDDFKTFYYDNIEEYNKCEKLYPNESLTTERIDPHKGYTKGNITFIPNRLQSKNREHIYKFSAYKGINRLGVFTNLKEFCRNNNLKYDIIRYYFKKKFIINSQGYIFIKLKGGL